MKSNIEGIRESLRDDVQRNLLDAYVERFGEEETELHALAAVQVPGLVSELSEIVTKYVTERKNRDFAELERRMLGRSPAPVVVEHMRNLHRHNLGLAMVAALQVVSDTYRAETPEDAREHASFLADIAFALIPRGYLGEDGKIHEERQVTR